MDQGDLILTDRDPIEEGKWYPPMTTYDSLLLAQ